MSHKLFVKTIIIGIIMTNASCLLAANRSYFFEDWRTYSLEDPDSPLNSDWHWDCTTPWFDISGVSWFGPPRYGIQDSVFVDDDRTCIIRVQDELGNPVINANPVSGPTVNIYVRQIILGYFNDTFEFGPGGGNLHLEPGDYTVTLWGELNAEEHSTSVSQWGGTLKGQIRLGSKQPEYGPPFPHDNIDTTYNLYAGTLMTTSENEINAGLVVGNLSPGAALRCDAEFNMYGGSIITNQLALANQDCNGVFNMNGGTITFQDFVTATEPTDLKIPGDYRAREATFNLGDVDATGTLIGPYTNITVGSNVGIFNGWGTVSFGGTLSNSGIIDANGYGIERDLDFSSMSSVLEPNDNAVGKANGWYAVNKGRLVLGSIPVTSGSNMCNWGEAAADTDIDMINSARITFSSSAAGTLTGSLLCDGRSDLPVNPYHVIGAWNFQNTASVSNVGIVVRYDDMLLAKLGLAEADLKIYQYQTNQWVDITSSINTTKKQISGSASSLGIIVAGVAITTAANCEEVHKIGQGYPGDLNYDCEVNFNDLFMFTDQWLMSGTLDSDFNHSSTVEAQDFSILAGDWLQNNIP